MPEQPGWIRRRIRRLSTARASWNPADRLESIDDGPDDSRSRGCYAAEHFLHIFVRRAVRTADDQALFGARGDCQSVCVFADGRCFEYHQMIFLAPIRHQPLEVTAGQKLERILHG